MLQASFILTEQSLGRAFFDLGALIGRPGEVSDGCLGKETWV